MKNNNVFSIILPPPNVTGDLHIGHALEHFIIDTALRMHGMYGYTIHPYAGFDHAGIITQLLTVNKLKSMNIIHYSNHDLFDYCMDFANDSRAKILQQIANFDLSFSWQEAPFTMDSNSRNAVKKAFCILHKKKLIYRDLMIVNWDTKLQTSISDLECVAVNTKSNMYHIRYNIVDSEEDITIATTRPETIFADQAIAVHPEDARWSHLIGKSAIIPIIDKTIPIISDERVIIEKGTGAVKITPAHDFLDFEIGCDHNLICHSILDDLGCIIKDPSIPIELHGLSAEVARSMMRVLLDDALLHIDDIVHAVNYSERSRAIVEPMVKYQWFFDTTQIADDVIQAIESEVISIKPKAMSNNLVAWMKNIMPWCISRQITWGHRIPAWEGPNGEWIVAYDQQDLEHEASKLGVDASFFKQSDDVLDTWFSSSIWPLTVGGWPHDALHYPSHTLVTGYDILFFWAGRMIISCMHLDAQSRPPFQKIVLHGLVRDAHGNKMSKSRGNTVNPIDIIKKYDIDSFKLSLISSNWYGSDIRFDDNLVKDKVKYITKIKNFARFCNMNSVHISQDFIDNISINIHNKLDSMHILHRSIIFRAHATMHNIENTLSDIKMNDAWLILHKFFKYDLCDDYLEAYKALKDEDKNVHVLSYIFYLTSCLFYPFIPKTITEICASMKSDFDISYHSIASDVHNMDYASLEYDKKIIDQMMQICYDIRYIRHTADIGMSDRISIKKIVLNSNMEIIFDHLIPIIEKLARVDFTDNITSNNMINFISEQSSFALIGFTDLSKFISIVDKKISAVQRRIQTLQSKLDNDQFMQNAPQKIIQQTRNEFENNRNEMSLLMSIRE